MKTAQHAIPTTAHTATQPGSHTPFFPPFIQPKLTINQPNDEYEQEADAMADKVMRMKGNEANRNLFFKPAVTPVQRKCAHCEEEEKAQLKEASDIQIEEPASSDTAAEMPAVPDVTLTPPSLLRPASEPDYLSMRQPFINRNVFQLWDPNSAQQIWQYNFDFFRRFGLAPSLSTTLSNLTAPRFIDAQLKASNPTWWEITDRELNTSSLNLSLPLLEFGADFSPLPPSWFKSIFSSGKNDVQRKCAECEEEEKVQRKENPEENNKSAETEHYLNNVQSSGNPMGDENKSFFETRTGYDFSGVRIHNDSNANESAKNINALAYTHKNDIVFGAGQYQPDTDSGKRLLAHELTHVVQQNPGIHRKENEADAAGLNTRTYWDLLRDFDQYILAGNTEAASALVPAMLDKMSVDDVLEDTTRIGVWLLSKNNNELAATVFQKLEDTWQSQYQIGTEKTKNTLAYGFLVKDTAVKLAEQGEQQAKNDSHDMALQLLETAYFINDVQLKYTIEDREKYKKRLESISPDIKQQLKGLLDALHPFSVNELLSKRARILNVYPNLIQSKINAGDTDDIESLQAISGQLQDEIRQNYTVVYESDTVLIAATPKEEQPTSPVQPVAPGEEQKTTPAPQPQKEATPAADTKPKAKPVRDDVVVNEPPPFNGDTVFQYTANRYGHVASTDYVKTDVLSRAFKWASFKYGKQNSVTVVVYEPDGSTSYYVAGMDTEYTPEDFHGKMDATKPGIIRVQGDLTILRRLPDNKKSSKLYDTVMVFFKTAYGTAAGSVNSLTSIENIIVKDNKEGRGKMDPQMLKEKIFTPVNDLISQDQKADAATRLETLTADAFSTISMEERIKYLELLLDEWTTERREKAILEIIKSVDSKSQLDAIFAKLKEKGKYKKLFGDLDHELWNMLTDIGGRFGTINFTLTDIFGILRNAGLLKNITGIMVSPAGVVISNDAMAEIQEAAAGFTRFCEGIWDAILMLVTQPDKLIEGIGQLAKMVVMFKLAELGHPPAVQFVTQLFKQVGKGIFNGLRGAQLTGMEEYLLSRIRWAIIWEVASWFIGVGEVTAALKSVGITEKLAAAAKFIRALGLMGEFAEGEKIAARVSQFAGILKRSSAAFRSEEEVLQMMSHLPENETKTLAKLLQNSGELEEGMTLTRLAAKNASLAEEGTAALKRVESLKTFAAKAGGMSDEVATAFGRMVGFEKKPGDMAEIIKLIPEGEGANFARAINNIPARSISEGMITRELLQLTAEKGTRANALSAIGTEAYSQLLRRAGNDGKMLDNYIDALRRMESAMNPEKRAEDFERLLRSIREGEPAVWKKLEEDMAEKGVKMPEAKPEAPSASVPAAAVKSYSPEAFSELEALKKQIGAVNSETEEMLLNNNGLRKAFLENPNAASLLKLCKSPCLPPFATPEQIAELEAMLRRAQVYNIKIDQAVLKDFFHEAKAPEELAEKMEVLNHGFDKYLADKSAGKDPFVLDNVVKAEQMRYVPGEAHGGERLKDLTDPSKLFATSDKFADGQIAMIPGQIARAMRGKKYKSFREFRETLWKLMEQDPLVRRYWSDRNAMKSLAEMQQGRPPFAMPGQMLEGGGLGNKKLQLNHTQALEHSGGDAGFVYDFDNLEIISPVFHGAMKQ